MSAHLAPGRLVLATHNAGKLREIAPLVQPFGIEPVSAGELGLPEPEETGDSFMANAVLKAQAAAQASGLPALADDSGLCVSALDGAPGIHSARWAVSGTEKSFPFAMQKVRAELAARRVPPQDWSAHFVCALALAWPDGTCEQFEGRYEGRLVWPPRGTQGFGYDAMFLSPPHGLTFGEMDPAEKHAISHRARAFAQLCEACLGG